MNKFDVIVVPDFAGAKAFVFEMRTLFFLASWLEFAGKARQYPLHIVCIGEPPASVRWLGKKCKASITVHEPLKAEGRGYANKLRGFEVEPQCEHLLLLDADVLITGDISGISRLGDCIAAVPDSNPRVSEVFWNRIYPALGIKEPVERIQSTRKILNLTKLRKLDYVGQEEEQKAMLPYYNTGIIWAPWRSELSRCWQTNVREIALLFKDDAESDQGDLGAVCGCDQAGFGVTTVQLQRRGEIFCYLPNEFHSHWMHTYRRTVPLRKAKIFHAFRIFNTVTEEDFDGESYKYRYDFFSRRLRNEWQRNDNKNPIFSLVYLLPALRDSYRFENMLKKLYHLHVREALQQNKN